MKLTELDTPSLLIDRDKLIRNIARAKASCAKLGVPLASASENA